MQFVIFLSCLLRCIWPMIAAIAGVTLCCLTFMGYETIPGGLIVAIFVLPSVLSFVLIEKRYKWLWLKHLGFILPVSLVIGWLIYTYFELRRMELEQRSGDGSSEVALFMLINYGIGNSLAYVFLNLLGGNQHGSGA